MEMNRVEGNDRGPVKLVYAEHLYLVQKDEGPPQRDGRRIRVRRCRHAEWSGKRQGLEELKRFNPQCSFPSLVLDNGTCIVGFKEAEIREALKP